MANEHSNIYEPKVSPRPPSRRSKKEWGTFSPLMRRIMAVNVIALGILGGGILYLDQFRDNLLAQQLEKLQSQAEIIAGALGETAAAGPEATSLNQLISEQIISRLIGSSASRARLFAVDGSLSVDSEFLGPGRTVQVSPLPNFNKDRSIWDTLLNTLNQTLDNLGRDLTLPIYEEIAGQLAWDFEEVTLALNGERETRYRQLANGQLMVTVAVPVQRFRRILGGLLLSDDTAAIQQIIITERLAILKIFSISLAVTLLLSFFLGSTIARPIRQLANAADDVRRGVGRSTALAKSSNRKDEIGDLSRALHEMTLALYHQISAVGSFAADVAHEIKNPLSSIRSAVETMKGSNDPKIHDKLLAIIDNDIKRLDRLITDISDASRLDAELTRGQMKSINLIKVIETLIDAYQATGEQKGITLIFPVPDVGNYTVFAIEGRIGQVLRNITDNAVSFSPAGSTITLSLRTTRSDVFIYIDDEGPGLPLGASGKIFERFYSERPSSEAFGTHSGLGLSISRQIIEAHGGTLEAFNRFEEIAPDETSDEGEYDEDKRVLGARFIIRLPK
jgi:two-component system sensor histidine kinase ChvG